MKFSMCSKVPDRIDYGKNVKENLVNIAYLNLNETNSIKMQNVPNAQKYKQMMVGNGTWTGAASSANYPYLRYNTGVIPYTPIPITSSVPTKDQVLFAPIKKWYASIPEGYTGETTVELGGLPFAYELRWDAYAPGQGIDELIKIVDEDGNSISEEDYKLFVAMGKGGPFRYSQAVTYYRYSTEYVRRYEKLTAAGASHIGDSASTTGWADTTNWTSAHWMWWNQDSTFGGYKGSTVWGVDYTAKAYRIRLLLKPSIINMILNGKTLFVVYNKLQISDENLATFTQTEFIDVKRDVTMGYQEAINPRVAWTHGTTITNTAQATFSYFSDCDYMYYFPAGADPRIYIDNSPQGIWLDGHSDDTYWTFSSNPLHKFSLEDPKRTITEKWGPIVYGTFDRRSGSTAAGGDSTFFYIPEVLNLQGGAVDITTGTETNPPAIRINREPATINGDKMIQLKKKWLYFWEDELHTKGYPTYTPPRLYDTIVEKMGTTEDPYGAQKYSHGITLYRNNIVVSNTGIDTYDLINGRIWFDNNISKDDNYIASYLIEKKVLLHTSINLNQHTGHKEMTDIDDEICISVLPYEAGQTRSLVWHYRGKSTAYYLYQYRDNPTPATTVDIYGKNILCIGVVKGINTPNPKDYTAIDTRIPGGGLKRDNFFERMWKKSHPRSEPKEIDFVKYYVPESRNFWDLGYWDGEPFRSPNFLIIRIPIKVRTDFVTRYIDADHTARTLNLAGSTDAAEALVIDRAYASIRTIIEKYTAAGSYWYVVDENWNDWSPSLHSVRE